MTNNWPDPKRVEVVARREAIEDALFIVMNEKFLRPVTAERRSWNAALDSAAEKIRALDAHDAKEAADG